MKSNRNSQTEIIPIEKIDTELQTLYDTTDKYETVTDEEEPTVIHFITKPNSKFDSGWWVELYDSIFIRPVGSTERLGLIYAFNIPIAPSKHYFKYKNEELHFTLFFPALPKGTTHIDIIEKPGGDSSFFNYYGVSMDKINSEPIKHYS